MAFFSQSLFGNWKKERQKEMDCADVLLFFTLNTSYFHLVVNSGYFQQKLIIFGTVYPAESGLEKQDSPVRTGII